jgi:hypothetical protein
MCSYQAHLSAFFYCSYVEWPWVVRLWVAVAQVCQTLVPVPLKPLHPDASLSPAKLAEMERRSTEVLQQSLLLGQRDCLKARPDGTILDDGHHRIFILRRRGIDVDALPREIVVKEDS